MAISSSPRMTTAATSPKMTSGRPTIGSEMDRSGASLAKTRCFVLLLLPSVLQSVHSATAAHGECAALRCAAPRALERSCPTQRSLLIRTPIPRLPPTYASKASMATKRQGSSQEHAQPRATARAATTGSTAGRTPAPSWRPTPDVTAPAATATKTLATVLRRARAPMDSHTTATPGKPARRAGTPAPSSRTRQAATAQAATAFTPPPPRRQ